MYKNNISGNIYDKYHSSNPVVKIIMRNFFTGVKNMLNSIKPKRILEIGCGEGYMSKFIYNFYKGNSQIYGIDVSFKIIKQAKKTYPEINFSVQSVYSLGFKDNYFDLIVCFEVLEHLENPDKAISEIIRVGKNDFIFTVPREPIWRILNVLRLKYLSNLGNTPGHINHWGKRKFISFISKNFNIHIIKTPLPFIQIFCKRKPQ